MSKKITFYSSYNRPPSKAHDPCPREQDDFLKDETTGKLVPAGKIPFYERIQSYHESTTLSYKLKRFALGDNTALGTPAGSYGDFSQVPNDLRFVLDSRKKVQEDFNNLPADLRAIFGDNYEEFEKSVRDGTAERRIYEYNKSKAGGNSSTGQTSSTGSEVNGGVQQ